MVQRPKYKTYNIYFSEENIGQKLQDIAFGSDFLTVTPKAQATKEKMQIELHKNVTHEKILYGTSLVVQGLRLGTTNAEDWSSISG